MAKHVLDLFELYKLVVAKGGLVEVINKKLWREITKGLNLPSSITSAAFTLRTQYMKYLYPYENDKLHLSTQSELNAAIDGNKREGRRPVYGYDHYPSPGLNNSLTANMMSSSSGPLNMNLNMNSSNGSNGIGMSSGSGMKTPGSNLSNELLNAAAASHHGLGIQPNGHHGIMQPHHFLAAAAAAGLLSAHHPAVNGHRLFDSSNGGQPSQQLGLSPSSVTAVNGQLPPASTMNPFIKQLYGEITPPSSSSSSSSSSTSSSCHRSDQAAQQHHHHHHNLHNQQHQHQINDSNIHHFNGTSLNEKSNAENEHSLLHVNSRRSSIQTMSSLNSTSSSSSSTAIKRPFEHLDQNLNENNSKQHKLLLNAYSNEIKETMAKKLAIDTLLLNNNNNNNNNSSKSSSSTPHNENHLSQSPSSPKMKIKILSKSKFFSTLFHS